MKVGHQVSAKQIYMSKTIQKTPNQPKNIQALAQGVFVPLPTCCYPSGEGEQWHDTWESTCFFGARTYFLFVLRLRLWFTDQKVRG